MKLLCFTLSGAAILAALMLAGTASAQVTGEDALMGDFDISSELGGGDLLVEPSALSASSSGQENTSVIRQYGEGNTAQVRQTSSVYGAFAIVGQIGADNTADVTQCGCGNFVDIIQDGNSNLSEITQTGRGNVFVHRQYGDALALSVAQYGGAQISVTQTGP